MAFQTAVNAQIGAGVVGEMAFDGPTRAQPAVIRSTSAANNVFGRYARVVSGQTASWAAGSAGAADPKPLIASMDLAGADTGQGGLLVNPKAAFTSFASIPTLALPNETVVELATEGDFWVNYVGACNPGDNVWALIADGTLVTSAPGAAKPANTWGPIGTVARFALAGAGIGVVHLEPRVPTLAP